MLVTIIFSMPSQAEKHGEMCKASELGQLYFSECKEQGGLHGGKTEAMYVCKKVGDRNLWQFERESECH